MVYSSEAVTMAKAIKKKPALQIFRLASYDMSR